MGFRRCMLARAVQAAGLSIAVVALVGTITKRAASGWSSAAVPRERALLSARGAKQDEALLLHTRALQHGSVTAGRAGGGHAAKKRKRTQRLVWLSDPHVDPLYGYPPEGGPGGQECRTNLTEMATNAFGTIGCDPPYALLTSAARAAAAIPDFQLVLFTGDAARHHPERYPDPESDVARTIHNVSKIIVAEVSNGASAGANYSFGTLGNADTPENYYLNVTTHQRQNSWLVEVGKALVSAGAMSEEVVSSYGYGGFYEQQLSGLTVLQINTIIYSVKHQPEAGPLPEDPFNQFAWLRRRLAAAAEKNRSVWIVGHVPPGMETYGYTELWKPSYVEKYLEIVQDPSLGGAIAAQLFCHNHKEEFRLLPKAPPGAGPIFITSAISPVYRNNPMMRSVDYDQTTGRPVSFQTHYTAVLEGAKKLRWQFGYDLLESYEVLKTGVQESGVLYQSHFEKLAALMVEGGKSWDTYAKWYQTGTCSHLQGYGRGEGALCSGRQLNETQKQTGRQAYRCGLIVSTTQQYNDCVQASEWMKEGQKLSARLLLNRPSSYYHALREQWLAEAEGQRERAEWLREALSAGRWDDIQKRVEK